MAAQEAKMFVLYLLHNDMKSVLKHWYEDNGYHNKISFEWFLTHIESIMWCANNDVNIGKRFPYLIGLDLNILISKIIDYYCHKYHIVFVEHTIQNKIIKIYINE